MQGIYWRGLFFLDMYLPFGLCSAPYIFTSLMDLFVWICNHHYNLSNLSHFVDDFIYVAPPSEAWSSYKNFQNIASIFGVPFKVSKFIAPSPSIDYIGFHLDAPSMTISIPAEKRTRISTLLTSWLEISPPRSNPRSRSLSEARSLLGHLMHIVQILPEGKIFCDRLIRFTLGWKPPSTGRHHLSSGLCTDLNWWLETLQKWPGRYLISLSTWVDIGLYTDASGALGAGAFLGHQWWCLRWATPFQSNSGGYDIFWKEMFAIWVSLTLWGPSFRGRYIIVHCDNQACVESLSKGRAPHHSLVNDLIRRIVLLQLELEFRIQARYIESVSNPADSLSRLTNLPSHPQEPLPASVVSLFGSIIALMPV